MAPSFFKSDGTLTSHKKNPENSYERFWRKTSDKQKNEQTDKRRNGWRVFQRAFTLWFKINPALILANQKNQGNIFYNFYMYIFLHSVNT